MTTYNDREAIDFRIDNLVWQPYLPVNSYQYITSDAKQLTFKHDFTDERSDKYRKFKTSPYVNDEVNRLVNACLENTSIGKDGVPDLLTLSYYAGNYDHRPNTELPLEIQDMYVRLDNSIGDLLELIDRKSVSRIPCSSSLQPVIPIQILSMRLSTVSREANST